MATPTDSYGEFKDIFSFGESLTEWALEVTAQHAVYSNFAPPILMDVYARRAAAMGHTLQAAKKISYLEKKMKKLKQEMIELGWSPPAV